MNIAAVQTRIDGQIAGFGGRVGGAAELDAALANPQHVATPFAYVVWTGDEQETQRPVPGQQARFAELFSVVVAVDNSVAKHVGDDAVAKVEVLGPSLKAALVGWAPSASHLPCEYRGSTHLEMDVNTLFHQFDFSSIIPGGSIITYAVPLAIELTSGASVATVFANHVAAIEGVLGAGTRLTSDYLIDREVIPESATRYQLVQVPNLIDESKDSNVALTGLAIRLTVHHHLAPTDSERAYTETTMMTHLSSFLAPAFWRDPTTVRAVTENPQLEVGADLERE